MVQKGLKPAFSGFSSRSPAAPDNYCRYKAHAYLQVHVLHYLAPDNYASTRRICTFRLMCSTTWAQITIAGTRRSHTFRFMCSTTCPRNKSSSMLFANRNWGSRSKTSPANAKQGCKSHTQGQHGNVQQHEFCHPALGLPPENISDNGKKTAAQKHSLIPTPGNMDIQQSSARWP
jgi:hypothetical protein